MAVIDLPCGCRMYTEAEKLDYKQDRLCRYHEGEAATVAAIVAWLREDAKRFEGRRTIAADEHPDETTLETLLYAADAIERGEHLKGGKP